MPHRLRLFVLLLCLAGLDAGLQAVTAYPYGSLPTGAADADLTTAYNLWKTRRYVAASCGYRVDNGGGNTYSEGMGYGMLMAAYLEPNDTMLNNLYTFFAANLDPRGVMNWSVAASSCSNNNANGASDGDFDVALALIRAAKRWPASANNWGARATTLLNACFTYYKDSCNGLKPGDVWGGCTDGKAYNPSYMRTGYMHSFDCYEGGTRWEAMRTKSYSTLNYWYTNYALPPDWTNADGSFNSGGSGGYYYDACRTPWVLATDYLWWGNTTAKNMCDKITAGMAAQGSAASMGDGYNYTTGAKTSSNHQPEFFGAVGVGSMTGSNSTFRDALYTELKTVDKNSYFADSLRVLYLMVMTGNFPEACNGGGPAGSPTRTPSFTASPTRTPTFTASPTPTPAFSLVKSASAASAAIGSTYTYYLDYANLSGGPDTTGVTPGMSLQFNNGGAAASGSSTNLNFRVMNATGASANLVNYRIRYFHYDATHTLTSDYSTYEYNDVSGQGTAGLYTYPAYTGGPRNANMEFRVTFAGGTVANGASTDWEGAMSSVTYSWTLNHADDWSYPGSASGYSAAYATNIVLEQNVAGTWKLAYGAYPGGAAAISNVSITDVLDSRVDYVGSTPAGTWTSGTRTFSVTIASLAAGASGRITLTAQINGTASAGNVVPNSASIGASGFGSVTSNTQNITVSGANTPTFTATRTPSPSATRTGTPSSTPSQTPLANTATFTPSATPTATRTGTPSITYTPSSTATRTATGTATPSATPLANTATFTPTATPSGTRSATPTASSSSTRTSTLSASPTASPTATRTATSSATPSATPLANTATVTPTATPSGTRTASASVTFSPSSTPSRTPTGTATPSNTPQANSPTFTPTATLSGTRSATASATPSATPSRTVTPSSTLTLSPLPATASVTPTATPTGTRSGTPSATGSATPTGTLSASPSATRTASPTATLSASPSATRTASPSATPSASRTATPTATVSRTRTSSPTISPTYTDVPLSSTLTDTPTVSPVDTDTETATPSETVTLTETATPTDTVTVSATPSASPTASPTATPSATVTPSASASATPSATLTATRSATVTLSATPTLSGTPSLTATLSFTAVPLSSTLTVTPTGTPTATRTATPTASSTSAVPPTLTATPTLSYTLTPTWTFTPVPGPPTATDTATAVPVSDGPLEIDEHRCWPNPLRPGGPGFISVHLNGRADRVMLKVYSRAWVCVANAESGSTHGAGWTRVPLPQAFLDDAGADAYYYVVSAQRGGAKTLKDGKGVFQILR